MSFTYFQDEDDFVSDDHAVDVESEPGDFGDGISHVDLENGRPSFGKSPPPSRSSVEGPLLPRRTSTSSYAKDPATDSRLNQKIYIASEDLTIVFAGFSTSFAGYLIYTTLCVLTFGFAYLLLRWLPRWRVGLIGRPTPLRKCQWVAIEVGSSLCQSFR